MRTVSLGDMSSPARAARQIVRAVLFRPLATCSACSPRPRLLTRLVSLRRGPIQLARTLQAAGVAPLGTSRLGGGWTPVTPVPTRGANTSLCAVCAAACERAFHTRGRVRGACEVATVALRRRASRGLVQALVDQFLADSIYPLGGRTTVGGSTLGTHGASVRWQIGDMLLSVLAGLEVAPPGFRINWWPSTSTGRFLAASIPILAPSPRPPHEK